MKNFINKFQYRALIARRTPCIIYFHNKVDKYNKEMVLKMDKLCEEFQLVLCYRIDWNESKKLLFPIIEHTFSDVLSFQEGNVTKKVPIVSENEVRNLFMTVFNDCIRNFEAVYKRLLKNEKNKNIRHKLREYDLVQPSYNINRKKIPRYNYRSKKRNIKKADIQNEENFKKRKPRIKKKIQEININNIYNEIVPVANGLPKIDVFFIPLSLLPTKYYFENGNN